MAMVFAGIAAQAQTKIAHINSTELLELMPEMKQIEEKIAASRKQWETVLLQKQDEFRTKLADAQKMAEDQSASKGLLEVKQKELEQLQNSYQELEQKANEDMQNQQQEFLKPLITKLKVAIEEVAKAKGYNYVLESTEGAGLIWGDPAHDLMPAVKTKLGI